MVYDIISKYHLIMNNIDYSAIPLAGGLSHVICVTLIVWYIIEVMVTEEGGASSNTPYCKHGKKRI